MKQRNPLGARRKDKGEDNFKMGLREIECESHSESKRTNKLNNRIFGDWRFTPKILITEFP
jgi:hypothetical protein